MEKPLKPEMTSPSRSHPPELDYSKIEIDKPTSTIISMSPKYPKYRDKFIIGSVILLLVVIMGGVYLLTRQKEWSVRKFVAEKLETRDKRIRSNNMGNKRLSFKDINGYWMDSQKAGKLFVIKGSVVNRYPDKRSFIRIRSNILDSKGTVVKSKIVYAGNPISDKELISLSVEEIDNRLRDKLGKSKMNTNILPNSSVPFMVVFSNLPKDLSQFEVEAISSSAAIE